jgi:hypothetical protein
LQNGLIEVPKTGVRGASFFKVVNQSGPDISEAFKGDRLV